MRALIILVAAISIFSCKSKQGTAEADSKDPKWRTDTVVVSFERTACFGKCPTFKADFLGNGTVQYHGINFVDNIGHFEGQIDASQLEMIYGKAKEIGFFEMEKKYDGPITDVPSQIYFLMMYGDEHRVMARYKAPAELKELGTLIDEVLAGVTLQPINTDH